MSALSFALTTWAPSPKLELVLHMSVIHFCGQLYMHSLILALYEDCIPLPTTDAGILLKHEALSGGSGNGKSLELVAVRPRIFGKLELPKWIWVMNCFALR